MLFLLILVLASGRCWSFLVINLRKFSNVFLPVEVQRTMLELLNQLDGFEATKNIKVIDT
jgi:hypothetical protein